MTALSRVCNVTWRRSCQYFNQASQVGITRPVLSDIWKKPFSSFSSLAGRVQFLPKSDINTKANSTQIDQSPAEHQLKDCNICEDVHDRTAQFRQVYKNNEYSQEVLDNEFDAVLYLTGSWLRGDLARLSGRISTDQNKADLKKVKSSQ